MFRVLLLALNLLVNPVSHGFADTFADPSLIRGQDGYWYAYATSDPLRSGSSSPHHIPIARSSDLTHWSYVGDAFSSGTYWAPDVRYFDGHYVMYYAAVPDSGAYEIDVATAPAPAGPWTAQPSPVVAPRPGAGGGYLSTIDPAELTAADGSRYLYFGSYYGGISVVPLSADGLRSSGTPTMVALDNKYEGAYVVGHDGYYYLFASSANCCAGPATGYAVSAGRSRSPLGPFTDAHGVSLTASRVGGTPVITQNGNRWIGTGHNAVVTDLSGQDYLVYHAIDRNQPYLDAPYGINRRPMLLDRLDWIDGWPVVRAGAGASDTPQPAPVTTGADTVQRSVNGTVLRPRPAGDVRVEVDLRVPAGSSLGLVVGSARVSIDRAAGQLVAVSGPHRAVAALPAGLDFGDWHNLAVSARGGILTASLTEARLGGPLATVTLPVPSSGPVGYAGRGEVAHFSAERLYRPVTRAIPQPAVGRPVWSDEFSTSHGLSTGAPHDLQKSARIDNGGGPQGRGTDQLGAGQLGAGQLGASQLGAGWSWVRPDDAVTVSGGSLNWPVQNGDLSGPANTASVLLRTAPRGDYTVETRLTLDLGVDDVRNYQQAGLIAYVSDDDFARLDQVAIWNTRQIEFGREIPYAGGLAYGGVTVGTPATTTWLRLVHRIDPVTGEHRFRSESSTDGRTWTLGGVWTFPAGEVPKIGLDAHGGATPAVTAHFDYVRVYQA
ncbi:family 43 glycosylhydrolase [Actinoplanes sp. NPDC051411]|uniref:family 43 glycosylhydrolase n=1 Tax=Actinoplanes sp. NPDC051411 TaxID=3155522 RepID=UPI00341D7151